MTMTCDKCGKDVSEDLFCEVKIWRIGGWENKTVGFIFCDRDRKRLVDVIKKWTKEELIK